MTANFLCCRSLALCTLVCLTTNHELPRNSRNLISERYGHKLWSLSLQKPEEPEGGMPASA